MVYSLGNGLKASAEETDLAGGGSAIGSMRNVTFAREDTAMLTGGSGAIVTSMTLDRYLMARLTDVTAS